MKTTLVLLLASFFTTASALGKVNVVTTTTDLAWAAKEIAGPHAEVTPLLKGTQNAHFVDAVPEFIRLVANADVVCQVGLALEIGWLPKVLEKAANVDVQKGGKGYCEAGAFITPLDKATGAVDRSMGDVHPEGNPHFWLSPEHLAQGAAAIKEALVRVDAAHKSDYETGYQKLKERLTQLAGANRKRLAEAAGGKPITVIQYHKDFDYFIAAYKLVSAGSIEEKPGVPPSAGRLARVAVDAKKAGVQFGLAVDYDPKATVEKFTELSKVPVLRLPNATRPQAGWQDYEKLHNHIIDEVIRVLKTKGHG